MTCSPESNGRPYTARVPPAPTDETLRSDAVVVGTGAGGGPVAARLAEAGLRVLVLEAGPRLETSELSGDEGEMTSRLYLMRQTSSRQSLYAGACVGGSTLINDALCWRTPPEVLARWRNEHGLDALTDEAFAPFVDDAWAGLSATQTDRAHWNRNAAALARGAQRLGWAWQPMHRSVIGCANLGLCNFGCPAGAKQSTARSFVPRAERAGARVVPDARANRIEIANGAVRAVLATRVDALSREPIAALRVEAPLVVVAAGVLGTAPLLLRSGIAGAAIGAGVQFHTSVHVAARFDEPVHGYYGPTMAAAITEFSDAYGRTGPGFMLENTAVHPIATASALPGFGVEHDAHVSRLPFLARALVVLRDRARGRISLDNDGASRIEHALESDDRARLAHGMVALARAHLAAGAREVILPIEGSTPVRAERDLAAFDGSLLDPARASLVYAVHLFGGAIMGREPATSVCDVEGRVHGVTGLVLADASVLPTNTGVNPQVTIVANALRVASLWLASQGVRAGGAT